MELGRILTFAFAFMVCELLAFEVHVVPSVFVLNSQYALFLTHALPKCYGKRYSQREVRMHSAVMEGENWSWGVAKARTSSLARPRKH